MYYSNITRTYSAQMIQGWPISIQLRLMLLRGTSNTHNHTLNIRDSESQWTCCLQFVRIWCFCLWQLPANAPGVCSVPDLSHLFVCSLLTYEGRWSAWHVTLSDSPRHTSHFVTRRRSLIYFMVGIKVPKQKLVWANWLSVLSAESWDVSIVNCECLLRG